MKLFSNQAQFLSLITLFSFSFLALSCESTKQPENSYSVQIKPTFLSVEESPKNSKNWDPVNMFSYDHKPDVYYEIWLGQDRIFESESVKDDFKPKWDKVKPFYIPDTKPNAELLIKFYDFDKKMGVKTGRFYNNDDLIGEIKLTIDELRKKAQNFDTLSFGSVKACVFAEPVMK